MPLGTISYGLYVFHYPAIWTDSQLLPDQSLLIRGVLALAATTLVSAFSYELMEKKLIGMKDRYFARVPVAAVPQDPTLDIQ